MRIVIAESEGWKRGPFMCAVCEAVHEGWFTPEGKEAPLKRYHEDLNAILPLLPEGVGIRRYRNGGWLIGNEQIRPISNQSLALAACEFYLKWKRLWKD